MNRETSRAYDAVIELYDQHRSSLTPSEDEQLTRELFQFFQAAMGFIEDDDEEDGADDDGDEE